MGFFKRASRRSQAAKLNKTLLDAVMNVNLAEVKAILEKGADVNAKSNNGWGCFNGSF